LRSAAENTASNPLLPSLNKEPQANTKLKPRPETERNEKGKEEKATMQLLMREQNKISLNNQINTENQSSLPI
jgi:hypothetical protein